MITLPLPGAGATLSSTTKFNSVLFSCEHRREYKTTRIGEQAASTGKEAGTSQRPWAYHSQGRVGVKTRDSRPVYLTNAMRKEHTIRHVPPRACSARGVQGQYPTLYKEAAKIKRDT